MSQITESDFIQFKEEIRSLCQRTADRLTEAESKVADLEMQVDLLEGQIGEMQEGRQKGGR